MKRTTIKDLAKSLNVSISTVSRAFNDKYDIRPETRERVLNAAREMGYVPNPIARKLVKQKSFNIGIVVPEFEHAFFPGVIKGAQQVLLQKNYQSLIMQSNESWETERRNVETLVKNVVDGLIISLSSEDQNLEYYNDLIEKEMPIVFFNRVSDTLNASKVVFDDYKWAFFATEHLLNQGIKNIVHLTCSQYLTYSVNRLRGFRDAHKKHNIKPGKVIECDLTVEGGEAVVKDLIERNEVPEALFCSSDFSAIGAMTYLKKEGYTIPEDVSVVGFSESRLAKYMDPPLTTVLQPTELIGETAAELLLSQINSKGVNVPQTIVLNGQLKVRESSMRVLSR